MSAATAAADAPARGWMARELFQAGDVVVTTGGLAAAVAALLAAWLLSWLFRRALTRLSGQAAARDRQAAIYTVGRIVHYLLLVVGLLFALEFIGLPASRFAVFAGAVGVGLGFGLQAIFNNFISGLILLFDRSLKVGDFVELESGVHGEVSDINIRATRITTNDNIEILVPNSEFVTGRVVNWTHNEVSRRLRIPFGVAYGSDKETVKAAALEAASAVPFTLSQDGPRRPQVWLVGFGDSSLDFELVVWLTAEATKRPSAVKAAYNWELESALARHGLEIPFPQRDLHLRSAFGLQDQQAWAALGRAPPRPGRPPGNEPAPRAGGNDAKEEVEREIAQAPSDPDDEGGSTPPSTNRSP
ncbi:MAG TPA: mechanosensitive ion channel domain-containing protein [Arenimonas sp.]|uniref:mechanosensitive ion channel family protein n=1 Tax=Arenimonas sp. TaxID=1872635 RepID=UPI002D7F6AAF|nr:mechanosensitive ion channel domain-containing protein [Arenimonas sp.]HEU0152266.1 mechanosensitive ion channel domain-containing protein [Arenimonas sp.]